MTSKSQNFLNALLQSQPEEASQFAPFLPEKMGAALDPESAKDFDAQALMASPQTQIGQIHYSWLAEQLGQEPVPLQTLFLASLPEASLDPLKQWFTYPDVSLSEPVQNFLLLSLISRLFPKAVLPFPCLPPSPLKSLLGLPKPALVRLIGLLGLYDLALELRQTLDKEAILAIQKLLSPTQKETLDGAMRQQDILPATSYGIAKWGAGKQELSQIAQRQGLARLGKALANEERSLLWHVAHKLDTGRGKLIISYGTQDVSPAISKRLTQQILDLLPLIVT